MWPYWTLFLFIALMVLVYPGQFSEFPKSGYVLWASTALVIFLFIGTRHETGGDWFNYVLIMNEGAGYNLLEALSENDPGYSLLAWVANNLGASIHFVNIFCALIFTIGIMRFCRQMPSPWLALLVSMPYLIIVVSLGYIRQSVALGFILLIFSEFSRGSIGRKIIYLTLAASFHKTSVLLFPILLFSEKGKISRKTLLLIILCGVFLSGIFLYEKLPTLVKNYLIDGSQSSGARIRLWMNAIPGIILLALQGRMRIDNREKMLYVLLSIVALMALILLYVFPFASTALDRLSLYLIPLQIFVLSAVSSIQFLSVDCIGVLTILIIFYCFLVQLTWFNTADNSMYWLPYNSLLFFWNWK